MAIDVLHALYLGISNAFCIVVVWALMDAKAYADVGTQDENVAAAILVLRRQLMAWYGSRRRSRPDETLTTVSDLTVKMVGEKSDPKLKVKGG